VRGEGSEEKRASKFGKNYEIRGPKFRSCRRVPKATGQPSEAISGADINVRSVHCGDGDSMFL
jgi:hypothetical protein